MQFHSVQDASLYLLGSVINIPDSESGEANYGYVTEVRNHGEANTPSIRFAPLGRRDTNGSWISLNEVTIPTQQFTLGNINYNERVVYSMRLPVRRTQMGITSSSVLLRDILPENENNMGRPHFNDIMHEEGFSQLLENNFPSLEEALSKRHAVAIDRDFALNPVALTARHLHYKGGIVGELTGNMFTIYEPVAYVSDVLERTLAAKGEEGYEVSVAS